MRWLTVLLLLVIAALQYPLWLGKGSWLRVWEVDQKIAARNARNAELRARNQALDAEVRDLKQGYEAIEERARSELGMIKNDEVFYQVLEGNPAQGSSPPPARVAPAIPPEAANKRAVAPAGQSGTSEKSKPDKNLENQQQ